MSASKPEELKIEELLEAAGIAFDVVNRCPHPACVVCADKGLPVAA